MSSPITSKSDPLGPAGRGAPLIEVARLTPPPEVIDDIAQAALAYDELQESGRELAFMAGAEGERVGVEVRDSDGNALEALSIAEALDLAAGKPRG